jgi:YtkA-like
VLVQSCGNQSESFDLTLTHEVSPQPPRVGQVTITLSATNASGPVTGARITLEGNMSHAGMAPVFAEATEIGPGRYRAMMELSMAGDWFVQVHLTLPHNRKLDRQFEIKGVASA